MINPETLKREKLLFAYTTALEQGDFARLQAILELAGSDAILERQILEMNTALAQPKQAAAQAAPKTPTLGLWQRARSSAAAWRSAPHRIRPYLGRIAGALALAIVLVVGVLALLGPGVGKTFSNAIAEIPPSYRATATAVSATKAPAPTAAPAAIKAPEPTRALVSATRTVADLSNAYSAYPAPYFSLPLANQPLERLIVQNGSLIVVARDTLLAREQVKTMVAEFAGEGAFVVYSNETYPSGEGMPSISMALRVPVKRYNESMNRLAGLGLQVLDRKENAQDVTQAYVDTTARIGALETSRERLIEIIKQAKNTDDLLRAEQELARRAAELDSAKALQQNLEKTAALSSITLELRPAVTSRPVVDNVWNPANTLHNAVSVLLANLRGLVDSSIFFAIATLPWLVVIGLIVYGAVRLIGQKAKK